VKGAGVGEFRTMVIDPPWHYDSWPSPMSALIPGMVRDDQPFVASRSRKKLAYRSMTVAEIAALPVRDLADPAGCHLYLWTTNKYLQEAFGVVRAWGFRYSQLLIWAKTPMGLGPGGTFAQNAEFVIFARRGSLKHSKRVDSAWFNWPRTGKHSQKPEHFIDMVESVSPGPYLEMLSRRHRLGWDVWGDGVNSSIDLPVGA
jgi:N6-adenosine-specific RNA methylase IME4